MTVSREEFEALLAEVAALRQEVATLRGRSEHEEIDPEVLHVISAVVAAYLGKRATIRFVRKSQSGTDPWRTQGRVSVQASRQMPQMRGL